MSTVCIACISAWSVYWAGQSAPEFVTFLEPQNVTLFENRVSADVIS